MLCKNCKKELPDESQFCPYCMTKFGEEQEIAPIHTKSKKKLPIIIVSAILCIAIIVTGIIVIPKLNKDNGDIDIPVGATISELNQKQQQKLLKARYSLPIIRV